MEKSLQQVLESWTAIISACMPFMFVRISGTRDMPDKYALPF